jgi:flagellar biosynthesis protein FlhA
MLNIIFTLALLIIVCRTKKTVNLFHYPALLLLSTIFCLLINIASLRLILTKGADFDGVLIRFFSDVVTSQGIASLVMVFLILFVLTASIVITVQNYTGNARRLYKDTLLEKFIKIDTEHDSGTICDEESISQKNALISESNFYNSLDGASRFLSYDEIVRIIIFIGIILGGLIISVNIHAEITIDNISIIIPREETVDAAKVYIPLALGSGILFMFPALIQSATIGIILKRPFIEKEADKQL